MTDVIIVHSSVGNAHNHWYEWLGHNLTLEGYEVTLFNLERDTPANLDMWVTQMQQQINVRKRYIFCDTWIWNNHKFKIY